VLDALVTGTALCREVFDGDSSGANASVGSRGVPIAPTSGQMPVFVPTRAREPWSSALVPFTRHNAAMRDDPGPPVSLIRSTVGSRADVGHL
jgi:hypothetical protein